MAYINNDGDILKQPVINWEVALEQTGYVNNHKDMTIIIFYFFIYSSGGISNFYKKFSLI